MTARTDWRKAWRRMRCRNGRGALPRDRMGILAARVYYDRMRGDALPTYRMQTLRGRWMLRRAFPNGARFRPIAPFRSP